MQRTTQLAWRFILAVGVGVWSANVSFGGVVTNNCAQFTATSRSYIYVASSAALKLNYPMTLEVWVKPVVGGGEWALIFGKQNNPSDANPWYSYRFYASSANSSQKGFPRKVAFTVAQAGSYEAGLSSANVVPVDVWTHIAGVYDGQTMTVYINGIPENSTPLTSEMRSSDLGLYIGKAPWTNYNNYNGQMDEIRIWNVARTQAQIQTWMNLSVREDALGLVAYWPFNDALGSPTAADASLNNHVGTLYNGAAIVANSTSPVNPGVECVFQTDGTPGALVNGEAVHVKVLAKGEACTDVTAVPPAGFSFAGWTGGCTGTMNPLTIPEVGTDLIVVAHFTPIAVVGDGMNPWGPPGPTMHTLEDIYQKQLETQQRAGVMASPKTLSDSTVVVESGYYPATTLDAVDADLAAGNIVSGVSLFGIAGSAVQATGNATAEQVISGATFSKAGEIGLSGTMPNRGAVDVTPGTTNQAIPQGYHSGAGQVQGDADLAAGNIVAGANLFGVAGTVEPPQGTATADQVLAGATFSKSGAVGLTGTMPNRGAVNLTPAAADQVIAQGYHSGAGIVAGDPDLAATNILSGVSLFGVAGTAIQATGAATADQVFAGSTFSRAGASGLSGTMTDRGAASFTPGVSNQTIPQGYHSGDGVVHGDAELVPANVRAGIGIFGVTGAAIEATGSAPDSSVLSGHTFSRAGEAGRTGTMPHRGTLYLSPGVSDVTIPQGYHTGQGLVMGDADLTADNVRKGATLFGIAGTFEGSRVPVFSTGQTNSYLSGDDGDLHRGLAWPNPRFVDHGDNTVTDELTGLMWVKDPHALEGNTNWVPWAEAIGYCSNLVLAGKDDWRLPNILECESLYDYSRENPPLPYGNPFTPFLGPFYWTSTTVAGSTGNAWEMYMLNPRFMSQNKELPFYVWPVRAGRGQP